ncbi:hypothetical protein, partial [Staphylococcus aureus]
MLDCFSHKTTYANFESTLQLVLMDTCSVVLILIKWPPSDDIPPRHSIDMSPPFEMVKLLSDDASKLPGPEIETIGNSVFEVIDAVPLCMYISLQLNNLLNLAALS